MSCGQDVTGFALGENDVVVAWFAESHQVAFPVAELLPLRNELRAVMDRNTVGNQGLLPLFRASPTSGFALRKIPVQALFAPLFAVRETVNGLVADNRFAERRRPRLIAGQCRDEHLHARRQLLPL